MYVPELCVPIACVIVAVWVVNMKSYVEKPVFRLAFCSVISALAVVLMFFSSVIPVGTYALPCFAGILSVAVVIEYGWKWALGEFAVVSLISAFLSADKEAALYFVALFGYYPILKAILEKKLKNRFLQYLIKLCVFNIAAISSFFIATLLLSIPLKEFEIFGVYLPYVFLIIGNFFFIIYDFATTVFVGNYVVRIHSKLFKKQ